MEVSRKQRDVHNFDIVGVIRHDGVLPCEIEIVRRAVALHQVPLPIRCIRSELSSFRSGTCPTRI